MLKKIFKWNNNQIIHIPETLLAEVSISEGDEVNLYAEHGRIIVEPASAKAPLCEHSRFGSTNAGGLSSQGSLLGCAGMILLDKPYVSDFLKQTIIVNGFPVIDMPQLAQFGLNGKAQVFSEATAIQQFKNGAAPLLYSNSENAINWIANHLAFTDLPAQIHLLKDKIAFRQLLQDLYPDFYYQSRSLR